MGILSRVGSDGVVKTKPLGIEPASVHNKVLDAMRKICGKRPDGKKDQMGYVLDQLTYIASQNDDNQRLYEQLTHVINTLVDNQRDLRVVTRVLEDFNLG